MRKSSQATFEAMINRILVVAALLDQLSFQAFRREHLGSRAVSEIVELFQARIVGGTFHGSLVQSFDFVPRVH